MTTREITQMNESIEAEGWASMFHHTDEHFAAQFGMDVRRWGDGVTGLKCAGIDVTLFNRVMGIGVETPLTESVLDEIISDYAAAGVKRYALEICPDAQPAQLFGWLAARGFTPRSDVAKCYRDAAPCDPIPTELRIEKISVDQRAAYARTLCAGFELPDVLTPLAGGVVGQPGWHNYLAYDGDQPVAIGALMVQGEIGWIGGGATLPEFRRRGGQGALMARRIQDGIALGCKWFVTETGADTPEHPNPSYHNMLRTGFQLAYLRTDYLSPKL
ncbi:MAG TPA: hypothetical protein VHD90_10345 [Phototrophicaceae bacterium]|nr:hypothetical protein [Phototrophicaceae bacterium]